MTVTKWMRLEGAGNTIFSGASLSKLAEGEEKSWSFWLSNHSFPWNYVLESTQWYHIAVLFDGFVVELKMKLWQVSTFKTSRLVAGRSPKQLMEERSEILLYLGTFVCVTACINTYCILLYRHVWKDLSRVLFANSGEVLSFICAVPSTPNKITSESAQRCLTIALAQGCACLYSVLPDTMEELMGINVFLRTLLLSSAGSTAPVGFKDGPLEGVDPSY